MASCRSCTGPVLSQLNLGLQPVCNRFLSSALDTEYKHPLELGVCLQCGIMQLLNPFPVKELQPKVDWITYHEPEGHLDALAAQFSALLPRGGLVLGISFKDDSTLERLQKKGFRTQRLDLVKDLEIAATGAGVETIQSQLTPSQAQAISQTYGKADALIVRHILEHVYDIPHFLQALKELLKPRGYAMLEVPDCSKQLELLDYSTIWEEHLVYFTPETFKNCLLRSGFLIERFERVPDAIEGPMFAMVRLNQDSLVSENDFSFSKNVADEMKLVQAFCGSFADSKRKMHDFFFQQKQPLAVFGAGHSAAVLINLFELPVSRVIDDNEHKKGLYLPGSRVPICSSDTLVAGEWCVLGINPAAEAKIVGRFSEVKFRSLNPQGIYSLSANLQPLREVSSGVYYATGSMVSLDKNIIESIKSKAMNNERQRARICTHKNVTDDVHEMLIVHTSGTYVRPHKHTNKSESFHVVEGSALLILFDDTGNVVRTIELGDYSSGKQFYYRLDEPYYHT